MNRIFAWRALAAAVMGLAPSLALALCWIPAVKFVENTVAVGFSDLGISPRPDGTSRRVESFIPAQ